MNAETTFALAMTKQASSEELEAQFEDYSVEELARFVRQADKMEKLGASMRDWTGLSNTIQRGLDRVGPVLRDSPTARAAAGAGAGFLTSKMIGKGDEYVTPEGNVARKSTAKRTAALMALGAGGGALSHGPTRAAAGKWLEEKGKALKERFKKESSAKLNLRMEMEKMALLSPGLMQGAANVAKGIASNHWTTNALGGAAIGAGLNMGRNMLRRPENRQSMLAAGAKGALGGGLIGAAAGPGLQAAAPQIQKWTGHNIMPAAAGAVQGAAGAAAQAAPAAGAAAMKNPVTQVPTAPVPAGADVNAALHTPQSLAAQTHSDKLLAQMQAQGLSPNEAMARLQAGRGLPNLAPTAEDIAQSRALAMQTAGQGSMTANIKRRLGADVPDWTMVHQSSVDFSKLAADYRRKVHGRR